MIHAWLLPALLLTASAATVVDDKFADGDSQNQDLENNSLRLFNGRTTTVRTDRAVSVTFSLSGFQNNGGDVRWGSAIDYAPAGNTQPVTITVRAGTYN